MRSRCDGNHDTYKVHGLTISGNINNVSTGTQEEPKRMCRLQAATREGMYECEPIRFGPQQLMMMTAV